VQRSNLGLSDHSSARPMTIGGTVSPIAFAALPRYRVNRSAKASGRRLVRPTTSMMVRILRGRRSRTVRSDSKVHID
jgi:hypothetical protein